MKDTRGLADWRGLRFTRKPTLVLAVALALVLALGTCLMVGGCGAKDDFSAGHNDQVAGFLFISDTRPATAALVDAMAAHKSPKRATYDFGTKVTTTDPTQIHKLYAAMTDLILIGQEAGPAEPKPYYVEYELQDGTLSRFDFPALTTMLVNDQYFTIESGTTFYEMVGVYGGENR